MWECCISWLNFLLSQIFVPVPLYSSIMWYTVLINSHWLCRNKPFTVKMVLVVLYCCTNSFDFVVTGIDGARLQCCSKAKTSVCWEQCVQVCGDLEGRPFIWTFSSFRLNVLWMSKGVIKLALTEKTRVTRLYFWILCLAGF